MKFILIFWPQAVWKMTVWKELAEITWMKLFHNHMTIELVNPLFSYATPTWKRLVKLFREEIFKEAAKSDLKWLIFTYVWDFDAENDNNYVNNICEIFSKENAEIYFVELEANVQTRLERNNTEYRLEQKPTKRNLEKSNNELLHCHQNLRLNSKPWEIKEKNYLRIDNADKSPQQVATIIKDYFKF